MFSDSAINGPDCWKCTLHVEWHDCSWCPSVKLLQGIETRLGVAGCTPPAASVLPHPARRKNLAKPMKKIGTRKPALGTLQAFTLIELLTVIAIIGILAAMLMTGLPAAMNAAKKTKARAEMAGIINAIEGYDRDYSRFPLATNELASAGLGDFTCGYVANPQNGIIWNPVPNAGYNNSGYSYGNNNNVISILMDLTVFPSGASTPANNNHQKNPKQIKYLNAKLSGYNPANGGQPDPGVDINGVYRDPWGNPYVITMNTSYNEQGTSDLFYSQQVVSQDGANSKSGYNGLFNPVDGNGNGNHFLSHGKVMVWSAGPDRKADPGIRGNLGVNKDNVLSWK